ncbi:glutathione S-transferase family protein [uncultured Roseovarius sp.]|uniref:glutathione S-transferase family protein n=1 Tax=uncultured Roseovarius sp. TaxID=293344 RepID=UPI002604D0AA|nr:glutathione S-transferase family protein [uncultured Roseovarius sp.]
MTKYTLYCAPNTYAMCAHAVLEEVGADYSVHWVELFNDTPDPAFLTASPHCRTPALLGPDGTIFETGAVALYMAEQYPEAGLVIPPGDARRGAFLQWIHYLASTLQPDVIIQYHPEFYHAQPELQDALKQTSMIRLSKVFETLDAALSVGPYFFGTAPTVPDFILGTQALWDVIFPDSDISRYPNIARHRNTLCNRSSVQSMLAQHQAEASCRHN